MSLGMVGLDVFYRAKSVKEETLKFIALFEFHIPPDEKQAT